MTRRRSILIGAAVLLCVGCTDEGLGLQAPDGASGVDGGPADVGPEAEDAGGDPDAAACPARDGGASTPSRQTVRFALTNTSSAAWFVAEDGLQCAARALRRGDAPLVLTFNHGPECEGVGPQESFVWTWLEVPPGAQVELTWDARELLPTTYCVDCEARGQPGRGQVEVATVYAAPAAAGAYHATLLTARDLADACGRLDDGSGRWSCGGPVPGAGAPWPRYGDAPTCAAPEALEFTFSLPASGDLVVPVALP
jgi:hypothetical protein